MSLIAEIDDWEVLFHDRAAGHNGKKPGYTEKTIHNGSESIQTASRTLEVLDATPLYVIRMYEKTMFLMITGLDCWDFDNIPSASLWDLSHSCYISKGP